MPRRKRHSPKLQRNPPKNRSCADCGTPPATFWCRWYQYFSCWAGWRLPYFFGDPTPARGDIVMFRSEELGELLVKRVIGLGGDTITFADGDVYVNGEALEETYLPEQHITYPTGATEVFEVPEGCIFVMGDNRTGSYDSRAWLNPYIPVEQIRSRALVDIAFLPECTWKGVRLLT